jgi:probable F420-dependent oxidoreductase
MALQLGTFGVWLNPAYDDSARTRFVVEAEALGYTAAWLGMGNREVEDLSLVERALDATTTITVATGIVNIWTNDPCTIGRSYQRIVAKHPDRFLLGVGVGHPEAIATYRYPLETMASYLDDLDAGGVPKDRRVLAALGPRALRLAAERAVGAHPYLVVPDYTRQAREILGSEPLLAPEHKAVVSTDAEHARAIGRDFVKKPYLGLRNYVNNLLRHGFTAQDLANGGSDRLIDALVLHGTPERIKAGLSAHLEAGANHVCVQVLVAPGDDPMPGYRALAHVLV